MNSDRAGQIPLIEAAARLGRIFGGDDAGRSRLVALLIDGASCQAELSTESSAPLLDPAIVKRLRREAGLNPDRKAKYRGALGWWSDFPGATVSDREVAVPPEFWRPSHAADGACLLAADVVTEADWRLGEFSISKIMAVDELPPRHRTAAPKETGEDEVQLRQRIVGVSIDREALAAIEALYAPAEFRPRLRGGRKSEGEGDAPLVEELFRRCPPETQSHVALELAGRAGGHGAPESKAKRLIRGVQKLRRGM